MQKDMKFKIAISIFFSVLFIMIIIGLQVDSSIEAADKKVVSTEVIEVASTEANEITSNNISSLDAEIKDSNVETTPDAIDEDDQDLTDVTCEIVKPKVPFDLKYNKYLLTYTYILIENTTVNIRKGPSTAEAVIRNASRNEKLNYIETIVNGGKWYHITWQEKDQQKFGFVDSQVVTKRIFQFDKMHSAINVVEQEFAKGKLTFINNYNNWKGKAPAYNGGDLDHYGNRRSQSAPGYPNPSNQKEFIYIGDGSIVRILSWGNNYTKAYLLNDGKEYFIPTKYLQNPPPITNIKKAIVIDRGNQNEAVFEKVGEGWKIISYSLATTGKTGKYHQPTPLGYYYGIEKKERFYYYVDGTTTIQGYAPYTIRFAGGAYVHGVGVDFKYNAEGQRIDPGKIEYSKTIGTVPLSHKCVRNYTSHAKFIYDWYSPGETIVVVIE